MSETPAVYQSDTAVRCPSCGRVVGYYTRVGAQVWLTIGCLTCRVIRSRCKCGAEFDYMASGKKLDDLIERIKNERVFARSERANKG